MSRAERVYRRLLVVLPGPFRDEAGPELLQTFRAAYDRSAARGARAQFGFWSRIAADLIMTGAAERPRFRVATSAARPARARFSLSRNVMGLLTDLRMAVRALVAHRGFTLPAVLTLMLGVGAATAIFSVVNAVLLAPLPYRDPARLVLVWQELRARNVPEFPFPLGDIPDLREKGTLFEDIATIQTGRSTVTTPEGGPEQIRTAFVTPNLTRLLGLRVLHGRDFEEADGTPLPPPAPGAASIRQRTAEIGVRMAFGAARSAIFRLIVGRGLALALVGLVLGAATAFAVLRAISSLLVGVGAADPPTFIAISVLFVAVAAIACMVPAYRASRLDATAALRAE